MKLQLQKKLHANLNSKFLYIIRFFRLYLIFFKIKSKTRNSKAAINGGGINDTESNSNDSSPKSPPEWWSDLVTPECEFDISLSGKLVILTKILSICREKEDKL